MLILYFLSGLIGCIVGYMLGMPRIELQEYLDTEEEKVVDEASEVYSKRSRLQLDNNVPYDLYDTYFAVDDDGKVYLLDKRLYDKYSLLLDGDEELIIMFNYESFMNMYRRIVFLGCDRWDGVELVNEVKE